jgi:hypothetical protein
VVSLLNDIFLLFKTFHRGVKLSIWIFSSLFNNFIVKTGSNALFMIPGVNCTLNELGVISYASPNESGVGGTKQELLLVLLSD